MWRERITTWCPIATYAPGCSTEVLDAAERELGVQLPHELRELLTETDGVLGQYGAGLIWPHARIVSDNQSFRSDPDFRDLYMPFDHLLFFADAGNGDLFAFAIHGDAIRRSDVFAWEHESDSRAWVAPSLERYLEWWLSGQIKL